MIRAELTRFLSKHRDNLFVEREKPILKLIEDKKARSAPRFL